MVLLLVLLASGLNTSIEQTEPVHVTVRLRAYADRLVGSTVLQGAVEVARGLLASAGLVTDWRICHAAESCPPEDSSIPEVVVILSSTSRWSGQARCGTAALDASLQGTVIVWVPCVQAVADRLSKQVATRSDPMFATRRYDDIVGAAVAHEIGHVLGLRHAPSGPMRARFESDEIRALRQGRLAFSAREADTMRGWLASAAFDGGLRTARH